MKPEEGLISRRIFADPEIYQMEIDRIFGRGWFFLGHESEIPNPGDLVSCPCGIDPAILVRDDEGIGSRLSEFPPASRYARLPH